MKNILTKVLTAIVLLGSVAGATTSNWTGLGGNNDFNNTNNWDNGVPTDTAGLNGAGPQSLTLSANTSLNGFTLTPNALVFTIANSNAAGVLSINGVGVLNNSGQALQFVNTGTILFNNGASAGASVIQVDGRNGPGSLIFNNNATAGNALIKPEDYLELQPAGIIQFNDSSTAGNATLRRAVGHVLNSSLVIQFNNTSSAGLSTITGDAYFDGSATAANAMIINNNNRTMFQGASTAGNATLTNQGLSNAIGFFGTSNAGQSTIISANNSDSIEFGDSASAAAASITNTNSSKMLFTGNSTAGASTIINSGQGLDVSFQDPCFFGTYADATNLMFCNSSNAGTAAIQNSASSVLQFAQTSSAANAVIVNNSASSTTFHGASNAAGANITNSGTNTGVQFFDVSNAGSANIANQGIGNIVQFNNTSTAGNATITNNGGGFIQFHDMTNGGASTIVNSSGTVDVTSLNSSGLSMGSISGAGTFLLGSKNLTVGSNGLSTAVPGTISGNGGSIVKVGTGTLTLSGVNTYTGGTTINSGTLGIADNNSLGSTSGSLTIAGGSILQTNGSITSGRTVTLNGGGTIDTNGFDSAFSGAIAGSGSLAKIGGGTLLISGSNSYSGDTLIAGGTLEIGSANALPNGTSVVLADTHGATLDLNGFNQTIGSLSGGGGSGGNVILGTGTLTTGTDNSSSQYTGVISGSGSVIKVGTGTLVLSENNTYTGNTTVNGGNLVFIDANPGASPTASLGSIGNLHNNSVVTPGVNGIGVLHVTSYSGPGVLNISFNGSNHTALVVDGNAALTGGKLNLVGSRFSTGRYDIITAGSITGAFTEIDAPLPSAFLNIAAQYSPTAVQVNITALSFADVAETGNQQTVAAALDADRTNASGDFDAALQAIFALPTAAQARAAYNQISGDSLASFQNAGLRSADVFTRQMSERSGTTTSSGITQAMAPIQLAYAGDLAQSNIDLKAPAKETVPAYGLWSRGLGFIDNVDANASVGSPSSKSTTGGFQAGYDFQVADDVLLGLSGGYAKTSLSVDDRSSSGNSTSVQSGIYASYTPGPWFVNGSLAYTTSSNDMTRTIQFIGVNEQASASFQSRVYTTYVEGGYQYKLRRNSAVEPTISLKHSRLTQEAFTESGAPGLNLSVEDQTINSIVSALGARITHQFGITSAHPITVGVRAAWEHELGDTDNKITSQFAEAPLGGTFTTQATPRSRNAAAIGLDGRVTLTQNLQAFLDYSATLGSGQNTQGLFGGVSVRW